MRAYGERQKRPANVMTGTPLVFRGRIGPDGIFRSDMVSIPKGSSFSWGEYYDSKVRWSPGGFVDRKVTHVCVGTLNDYPCRLLNASYEQVVELRSVSIKLDPSKPNNPFLEFQTTGSPDSHFTHIALTPYSP
jgi:hypothetical protein